MDWGNFNIRIILFIYICAVTLFTSFLGEFDAEKLKWYLLAWFKYSSAY